jgi:uncharacterized protein YndB with AHSA1/START domain
MSSRDAYMPGPAAGAEVRKDGDNWTLILVREMRHPPEKVWKALTDPTRLREWAPFDANRNLGAIGPVSLTMVGTPTSQTSETQVTRAEEPSLLEYRWDGKDIRWQLEPLGDGTRLTLWHSIDRDLTSMVAAGWHICLDVLKRLLANEPVGRIVSGDAMQFGWPRLNIEYAERFGIEPRSWNPEDSQ